MMDKFIYYLQHKKYKQSTINSHLQNVGYFVQWLNKAGLYEAENVSYSDLLNYVQYEQQQNKDIATINLRLGSISKYYEHLKQLGTVSRNPAMTLRIKGKLKTIIENPLIYEELETLYHGYKAIKKEIHMSTPKYIQQRSSLCHERNIVIVGLMIWQGLHGGELGKLEVEHINLQNGTIYIPSTSRSNSRELKLHPQQILSINSYIYGGTRDKLNPKGEELFAGRMDNIILQLMEELKGLNPQIRNAQHIRASVILHWLSQYNKRQVQYMAGHKYIDSTERYAIQKIEELTDLLVKHHPFG